MNISKHETQRLVAAEKDGVKISVTISDQTKSEIRKSPLIEGYVHEEMEFGIKKLMDSAVQRVFSNIPPDEKPKLGQFIVNKKEVHVCVSIHVYVAKED